MNFSSATEYMVEGVFRNRIRDRKSMAYQHSIRNEKEDLRLETAQELLAVIRQEAAVLERLDAAALLEILPRKEVLINRLMQQLESARKKTPAREKASETGPLKHCLSQIREANEHNRVLIEKSLEYWQEMLSVFVPKIYGRQGKGDFGLSGTMVRGARLNREV